MTRLDKWYDALTREFHWHIVIDEADAVRWERERLDMIEDGMMTMRRTLGGRA